MTSNQKKVGLAVAAAILCGLAFYFLYWIKTPTYSLGLIRDAVQKHDVAAFEKHVDMDTLYNKVFDDAVIAMGKIEGEDFSSNPLAAGFIQMMKPAAVAALKDKTIEAVKGNSPIEENSKQQNNADHFTTGIKEKSGLNDSDFRGASVLSKEGNEAVVAVTIHNKQLDKDLDLNIKMTKLDDSTWKVKEITNMVDFIVEVDKAEKAKLAELNKPIAEKIQNSVSVSRSALRLNNDGNPYFASYWLEMRAVMKNISSQDITSITVKYTLLDQNNAVRKEEIGTYNQNAWQPGKEIGCGRNVELNPFINTDNAIKQNMGNYKLHVEVVSVKFADNSTLALLKELPKKSSEKSQ